MSYVIRHPDGRYLQVWYDGEAITRVELVPKGEASSWSSISEARRQVLERYPDVRLSVEVR